jgi:hypothetical protein
MSDLPKVSGILPVGCGDRYFQVAMSAFLAQTYEGELELVVVDNSDKPIEDLLPDDDRIKYFRSDRLPVGALRNAGTSYATGDICITIDEDDYSHPDRVAHQVGRLLTTGKSVTGFHALYYYDTSNGQTYKYWYELPPRNHIPYACGSSQCYTKAWWDKHKFPTTGIEDYAFQLEAMQHNQLDSTDAGQLLIVRAHSDSVCFPTQLGVHRQFPAVPADALPKEFYAAIKTATAPTAKATQKTTTAVITGEQPCPTPLSASPTVSNSQQSPALQPSPLSPV